MRHISRVHGCGMSTLYGHVMVADVLQSCISPQSIIMSSTSGTLVTSLHYPRDFDPPEERGSGWRKGLGED